MISSTKNIVYDLAHKLLTNLKQRDIRSKNALRQNLVCTRNRSVAKKGNTSVPSLACEENVFHSGWRKAIFFCFCNVDTWSLYKVFLHFGSVVCDQNVLANWIRNCIPEAYLDHCHTSMMDLFQVSAVDCIWKKFSSYMFD